MWRSNRVIFGKVNETRCCSSETPNVQRDEGKVKIGPVLQKGSTGAQLASRGPVCLFLFVFLVEISSFSLERRLCVATTKLLVSLFGFENSEKRCGVMPLSESDTRIAAAGDGMWGGENIFVSAMLVETGWERGEGIARRSLLKKQGS